MSDLECRDGGDPRLRARRGSPPAVFLGALRCYHLGRTKHAYRRYATAGWSSLPWPHRVSPPALVVAAEDDPSVPLRNGRDVAARLPERACRS